MGFFGGGKRVVTAGLDISFFAILVYDITGTCDIIIFSTESAIPLKHRKKLHQTTYENRRYFVTSQLTWIKSDRINSTFKVRRSFIVKRYAENV